MVFETLLYDQLDIKSDAYPDDIKKSYRTKALLYHPDRCKDPKLKKDYETKFKEVGHAYSILADPQKRKMYDQFGLNKMKDLSQIIDINPMDMFSNIFGNINVHMVKISNIDDIANLSNPVNLKNMFQNQQTSSNSKSKKIIKNIQLDLQDFYMGTKKKIKIKRDRLCKICAGTGARSKKRILCPRCSGSGKLQVSKNMGMMANFMSNVCKQCQGKKRIVKLGDKCLQCQSEGIYEEFFSTIVNISPGTEDKEKIVLSGCGHHYPDQHPGDVIIICNEKEHDFFERKNHDLIYHKTILLHESLLGCHFTIDYLNGKLLPISYDEIIKPDDTKMLKSYGMPIKNINDFGNLYIYFDVEFPDKLFPKQKKYLAQILKVNHNSLLENLKMTDDQFKETTWLNLQHSDIDLSEEEDTEENPSFQSPFPLPDGMNMQQCSIQ